MRENLTEFWKALSYTGSAGRGEFMNTRSAFARGIAQKIERVSKARTEPDRTERADDYAQTIDGEIIEENENAAELIEPLNFDIGGEEFTPLFPPEFYDDTSPI